MGLTPRELDYRPLALQNDPYIYNTAWADFVALQLILEFDQNKRIDKTLTLALLKVWLPMVNKKAYGTPHTTFG